MNEHIQTFPVGPGLDEHEVWKSFAEPLLRDLKPNVLSICEYGVTEMVNNVKDHSDSPTLLLQIKREGGKVLVDVLDEGIGIFRKIQGAFDLGSERDAALELSKGRVTTDPQRHTGEGIFFTARMFDEFFLLSGRISFIFRAGKEDWILEETNARPPGTFVQMLLDENSPRTTVEVFDRFASERSDYQFDTTVLLLRLFGGESAHLVSRSQAKRLLVRLENFKTVILDFEGIQEIGPAFADEVFRVFQRTRPELRIVPLNANEAVNRMILRALTRNGEAGGKP